MEGVASCQEQAQNSCELDEAAPYEACEQTVREMDFQSGDGTSSRRELNC
jgi:hypothetical protein